MVEAVNSRNTSGLFMTEKNFLRGLGEKVYNSSGAVIGAREATLTWVGRCVQQEVASKVKLFLLLNGTIFVTLIVWYRVILPLCGFLTVCKLCTFYASWY